MFITWPLLPGDDLSPLPNKLTGYDFISCEGPSLKLLGHLDLGYQPISKGEGMAYRRDHNMWFAGVIVSAVTITSASLPYLRCADWHGSWPVNNIYISRTRQHPQPLLFQTSVHFCWSLDMKVTMANGGKYWKRKEVASPRLGRRKPVRGFLILD